MLTYINIKVSRFFKEEEKFLLRIAITECIVAIYAWKYLLQSFGKCLYLCLEILG